MKKKSITAVLLTLSLLLFVSCGKDDEKEETTTASTTEATTEAVTEASTEEEKTETATEAASEDTTEAQTTETSSTDNSANDDISAQIKLIADNSNTWYTWNDEDLYTVTDLDQNGRLEIIGGSMQGSGLYTYLSIYEVNEAKNGLNQVSDNLGEGEGFPDITTDGGYIVFSKDGVNTYIASDVTRSGMAENSEILVAFTLQNSNINMTGLAQRYENEEGVKYTDLSNDSEITEDDFLNFVNVKYTGYTKSERQLKWDSMSGDGLTEKLTNSYNAFAGK